MKRDSKRNQEAVAFEQACKKCFDEKQFAQFTTGFAKVTQLIQLVERFRTVMDNLVVKASLLPN